MQDAARGLDFEDAWLNGFCVSTNLTRGEVEVHRTGPAWIGLRASFSIPGVFPPMRTADGDLLVDGGVLDNMPVGIMRGLFTTASPSSRSTSAASATSAPARCRTPASSPAGSG